MTPMSQMSAQVVQDARVRIAKRLGDERDDVLVAQAVVTGEALIQCRDMKIEMEKQTARLREYARNNDILASRLEKLTGEVILPSFVTEEQQSE